MHPHINPYLLYEVMDETSFKPIFENLLQEKVLFKFTNGIDDLGMCKLLLHKHRDAHKLYIGGFAIDTKQAGKNYGCTMMQEIILFAKENNIVKTIPIGSALKYGRLAIAEVDVFPRLVGSSEWDTAAGQAVLESAGGKILDWSTGLPLRYGKKNFRNPRLLAIRAPYSFHDFKLKIYKPELL